MKSRFRAAWIVAFGLISAPLWAQVPEQTLAVSFGCTTLEGESTYEIWLYNDVSPPKSWDAAQTFAASRDLRGFDGHLATFSDTAEEECVLTQAAGLGLTANQQLWIGLFQDLPATEPADGWGWIGEPTNDYENWGGGEPNNAGGNENHATIGRYGYATTDGHNDEDQGRGTLFGFVVEYDVAALGEVPLDCDFSGECTIEIPSADPDNNTIVLPPGTILGNDPTADIRVFLIEESCPTSAAGSPPYSSRLVPFGLGGEEIPVPNYLCADRWILISSELNDATVNQGVVESQFEPADFGLVSKGCARNILNGPPALPKLPNPVATDIGTYLPSSENWDNPASGLNRLDPFMQEYTYDCGSSRLRTKGNQYFGVGLNFNFPAASTPEAQIDEIINLTRQKLVRLREAILEMETEGVVKKGDSQKMLKKVDGAIADIDKFAFDNALQKVRDLFDKFLDAAIFDAVAANDFNYQGEGLSRASNIEYLLDVYVVPYFP